MPGENRINRNRRHTLVGDAGPPVEIERIPKMSITETQSTTSSASPGDVARRTIEPRPSFGALAVNFEGMYQATVHDGKAGDGSNKIVYRSRPFNWKNQPSMGKESSTRFHNSLRTP
jgi:hypothetical protein